MKDSFQFLGHGGGGECTREERPLLPHLLQQVTDLGKGILNSMGLCHDAAMQIALLNT